MHKPLRHVFNLSIQHVIFPDKLKNARVTPIFKGSNEWDIGIDRPISVLPCFSKMLRKEMCNRVYKHQNENSFLFKKKFGFQKIHSTEHTIIQLVDQINSSFEKNHFTMGVFISLSKAFDTVYHKVLISKLEKKGVQGNNLQWFRSYFSNWKQFIRYDNLNTALNSITSGVPQGSILGVLLFLIYVSDLQHASKTLETIVFADDTNSFHSHQDINTLFLPKMWKTMV